MNGVIRAERETLGEIAGAPAQDLRELDAIDRSPESLDAPSRRSELVPPEAVRPRSPGKSRSHLRIQEQRRDPAIGDEPELSRCRGALLGNEQLDERRGIEVDDQRLPSRTTSLNGPAPLIGFGSAPCHG